MGGCERDSLGCVKNLILPSESALRKNEECFRLLVENARDIIYRYRFAPARGFEYVSPAVTAITGYTPEDDMPITMKQKTSQQ